MMVVLLAAQDACPAGAWRAETGFDGVVDHEAERQAAPFERLLSML
jgi:hypothetical protein